MRKLIPWDELIEIVFKKYSDFGRPSRSVLLMLCLEILKRRFQLSDEDLFERFKTDISFQYFCGFNSFSHGELPLNTSNMTKFRNRLDEKTIDEIENIVTRALLKHLPKKRLLSKVSSQVTEATQSVVELAEKIVNQQDKRNTEELQGVILQR